MNGHPEVGPPPRPVAEAWLTRYEAMMRREVAHRDAQLAAVTAVVRDRLREHPAPLVLELGCGPATLARRIADALPASRVVAADADPVLIGLGAAVGHPRVRTVETTIGAPGWSGSLGLDDPVDLIVSVAVVHTLAATQVRRWYLDVAELLAPDGALVLADAFTPQQAPSRRPVTGTTPTRTDEPSARSGQTGDAETWSQWWAAAAVDPHLARTARGQTGPRCEGDHLLSSPAHVAWLQAAGLATVTTAWHAEEHAVLVATRR